MSQEGFRDVVRVMGVDLNGHGTLCEELRKIKGNKSWDELLTELIAVYRTRKMENSRKRLKELLELRYDEVRVKGWAREY
ncbi:MAG TPA: hypothetical protein ENF57_01880 [Candidatus Korarchaeota archaeon]|nr:hypothetical protein [Candidatus Korarchaeota archaeon]